jgi:hypothetical protein
MKETGPGPPPTLLQSRVLAYATVSRSVPFSGRGLQFVGGKELGRVPRLALCQALEGSSFFLLHCSLGWRVLGSSEHRSRREAECRAARIYPGISALWTPTRVTRAQAEAHLAALWADLVCTFCGRRPYQVARIIQHRRARICDICVRECSEALREA